MFRGKTRPQTPSRSRLSSKMVLEGRGYLEGSRRGEGNVPPHTKGEPGTLHLDLLNRNPSGKSPGSTPSPKIMKSNNFGKVQVLSSFGDR